MSIEGLGKKFQDARLARGLSLDEAARMTKIRPSRLAEIEADDFSNFPSLAYAKGFLLIYGKFLDVDVSEFMEAFEGSEQVTVDGYSYLQESPPPKAVRSPVIRRRSSTSDRTSLMPFFVGVVIIVLGFAVMKFVLNIMRVAPRQPAQAGATAAPSEAPRPLTYAPTSVLPSATPAPVSTPLPTAAPTNTPALAVASPSPKPTKEPEVRRAEPVRSGDLAKANETKSNEPEASPGSTAASTTPNSVAIKPLRRTYVKVVVDNAARTPAFERWISPSDGTVEFKGQHINVRVLDRDAVQIRKNGKMVAEGDSDVTIE
jgi:cytoskeletal protein RodZ